MKTFLLCLIISMLCGCTTWNPIANVPQDLSGHFGDGGVLKPGDQVIVTTVTGIQHKLRITEVRDGIIYGDHDSVPFAEVASIERRDFSKTKTAVLITAVAVVVVGVAAAGENAAAHSNFKL
jgi:hypothetical protein